MREIVDLRDVNRVFYVIAIFGPVVGGAAGAAVGWRSRRAVHGAILGSLTGLLGTLNWALWLAYNAITDRIGLDTVRNLWVNLGLFVAVGVIVGLAARWLRARPSRGGAHTGGEPE